MVCDGFVGNLVLKSLEGFGKLIGDRLRGMFERNLRTKLAYLLLRRDVASLRQELDARETGGALLLGLNGIAVKAHGSSDARAHPQRDRGRGEPGAERRDRSRSRAASPRRSASTPRTAAQQPRSRRFWSTLRDRLRRDGSRRGARAPTRRTPSRR